MILDVMPLPIDLKYPFSPAPPPGIFPEIIFSILILLGATLLIEILVAFAFVLKRKIKKRDLWFIILANMISVPTLALLNINNASIITALVLVEEFGIFLFEGLFVFVASRKKIGFRKSFLLSLFCNSTSFSIGLLYFLIADTFL